MGFCLDQKINSLYEIPNSKLSDEDKERIRKMDNLIDELDDFVCDLFEDLIMKKSLLVKEN